MSTSDEACSGDTHSKQDGWEARGTRVPDKGRCGSACPGTPVLKLPARERVGQTAYDTKIANLELTPKITALDVL